MLIVDSSLRLRRLPLLGLLLSLLLYLGGGVLAAGHHHDDEAGVADHACATCLLAVATVAAVGAMLLSLPAATLPASPEVVPQRTAATVAQRPRARAPPALLI